MTEAWATTKRIVCLANSRKLVGRCIAGREVTTESFCGSWIRPVSERAGGEVSEYERQYEDGSDPRLLDVIDVPLLEPMPLSYQSENWLLDSELYWRKVGSYSRIDLPLLTDPVEPLWIDGHSTYHGRNDSIPIDLQGEVSSSLRFIGLDELKLEVFAPGEAFGNSKRRVQGQFRHSGRDYALWVTDPIFEQIYLARLNGSYLIGECNLTISLGEPYGRAIYKLIAAVIEP